MKHEKVYDLLLQALRAYRGAQDAREREKAGEKLVVPDLRLRLLAIAEYNVDLVRHAIQAEIGLP